jgi:hypothetical protein
MNKRSRLALNFVPLSIRPTSHCLFAAWSEWRVEVAPLRDLRIKQSLRNGSVWFESWARTCECYAVVKREFDRLLPDAIEH